LRRRVRAVLGLSPAQACACALAARSHKPRLFAWRTAFGLPAFAGLLASACQGFVLEERIGIEGLELDCALAHDAHVLAAGLPVGLARWRGDVEGDRDEDLGVESDAGGIEPERLDRPIQDDLAAVDRETAGGHELGDVASADGAVELTGVARLADGEERPSG